MKLHLVLTHHWYDAIESGRKRIEYRELSHHWHKRIWMKRKEIKKVTFARSYTSITLTFDVVKIDVGECPYDGFDGKYIRVHFIDETK